MTDPSTLRFTAPRLRADLVPRPRLQAALAAALQHQPLVLLSAPAGCGKTVALLQQLSALPPATAVAWLSVGEGDGLHQLLTALLAALDPFDLPWRVSPQALPQVAVREHGLGEVAAEVARALALADAPSGVIAIDDAHRIADARWFEFIERLLRELPPRWTLAITTRVDPPLPLARLRLDDRLAEFRETDLRFDDHETLSLLCRQKPQATAQEARWLHEATQGWAAGLTLGIMSARGSRAPDQQGLRAQRRIFEYMAEEVLEQLPPDFQRFLLRCSVLPQWTARRCAQVSGDPRAAHWLNELEQRSLFVSVLDGAETTLRLHDLFREFLEWQLLRDHPEELPAVLQRAAAGEPDVALRIGFRLRAGEREQALKEMMRSGAAMIHAGDAEQLLQLIERVRASEREDRPELAFLEGLCAWQRWAWDLMARCMEQAMVGFERQGHAQLAIQARALAVVALYAGEPLAARQLWQAAPVVPMDDTAAAACSLAEFMLSTLYGPASSSGPHLQRLVDLAGRRPESLHWLCFLYMHVYIGRWGLKAPALDLVQAVSAAADETHPQMQPTALLWRSALMLWRGDLPAARTLREQAAEEARWLGSPRTVVLPALIMTAMDRHVTGDDAGAQALLQQIADDAARTRRTQLVYLQMAGAFAAAASDWPRAQELLAQVECTEGPAWPYLAVCTAALRAEIALQQGDASQACALLRPRLQAAADGDWFGTHHRVRVGLARAELRAGDPAAAWGVLAPLLQELCGSGETLGLAMCGPSVLAELAAASWPADADATLLAALRDIAADTLLWRARPAASAPIADGEKALSERELQVVALVAQGLSNKVIARALGLSPHTVKRHMARIFDKTGESSRGRVAAWHQRTAGHTSRPSG